MALFVCICFLFSFFPPCNQFGGNNNNNQIENFPFFVFLLPQSSCVTQIKQRTAETAFDFWVGSNDFNTGSAQKSQSDNCSTGNHQNGTSPKKLPEYPQFSILQSAGFSSANPLTPMQVPGFSLTCAWSLGTGTPK